MRILIAIPWLPWPLDGGGNVAVVNTLACLQQDHEFTFVCPVYGEDGIQGAEELQAHLPRVRVRGIDCGSGAAVKRPGQLIIHKLRRMLLHCLRLLLPKPSGVASAPAEDIPEFPFDPLPAKFVSAVMAELETGFDLVQLEFVQMLSLGASLPADIPKLFVHLQLQFVYLERRAAVRRFSGYARYLEQMMLLQENVYLKSFDSVVVFSNEDARRLQEWIPRERIHISPFPMISGAVVPDEGAAEVRLVFVGSEGHFPNLDGLEWFLTRVWPEVLSRVPGCRFRVIGRWSEDTVARLSTAGVEFVGFVPDLTASLKGGVMLVPIRIGSGIRVKILDAMSHGIPVISTSIGCEGIPVTDESDILIRDDAKGFADAVVRLVQGRELRQQLAVAARHLVSTVYSPERVRGKRNEIYQSMLSSKSDALYTSRQSD